MSLIPKAKVNFRPGVVLTVILPGSNFVKVSKHAPKKKELSINKEGGLVVFSDREKNNMSE